jgi:hypothetical protein
VDGWQYRLTNRWSQPLAVVTTSSQHAYEVRPRKDHRGVDLISARSLFLVFAVFFEEFIEQHRVHCVVAHGVNFTSASRPSFARLVVVAGGAEKLVASRLQKTAVS